MRNIIKLVWPQSQGDSLCSTHMKNSTAPKIFNSTHCLKGLSLLQCTAVFLKLYCTVHHLLTISLEHLVYYVGILTVKHCKSCNFFASLAIASTDLL